MFASVYYFCKLVSTSASFPHPLPVFSPPRRYRSCFATCPTYPITGEESAKSGARPACVGPPCTVQRPTKTHRKLAPTNGITLRAKPVCWLQAASLPEPSAPAGCAQTLLSGLALAATMNLNFNIGGLNMFEQTQGARLLA